MSNTGTKALAITSLVLDEFGVPFYTTGYTLTNPIGTGHTNGGVQVAAGGFTESTFNLSVQQAVADAVNLQTENVDNFLASDVLGGRI